MTTNVLKMAYEYNLRRLFRPQLEQLSLSEQISLYDRRDLTYSHLFRLGTGLFSGSGISTRRRLIDASVYTQHSVVPHRYLFQRSPDGHFPAQFRMHRNRKFDLEPSTAKLESYDSIPQNPALTKNGNFVVQMGSDDPDKADDVTKDWYKTWTEARERMRRCLDGVSACKSWLLTKERTPVENTLLCNLLSARGNVRDELPNYGGSTVSPYLPQLLFLSVSKMHIRVGVVKGCSA